jgi:hypothetical protein
MWGRNKTLSRTFRGRAEEKHEKVQDRTVSGPADTGTYTTALADLFSEKLGSIAIPQFGTFLGGKRNKNCKGITTR